MPFALNSRYVCLLVGLKIQMGIVSRNILLEWKNTYGSLKMESRCMLVHMFYQTIHVCWTFKYDFIFVTFEGLAKKKGKLLTLTCSISEQSFGSQLWDTCFTIQAFLASDLTNEIGPTLARGHDFIKKSQVCFLSLKSSFHHNNQVYLYA